MYKIFKLQPLRICSGWKIEYNNFSEYDIEKDSEEYSDELKEDLLQLSNSNYNKKLIIDLAWYPSFDINGSYYLCMIENDNWNNILKRVITKSKNEVVEHIEKWTDYKDKMT